MDSPEMDKLEDWLMELLCYRPEKQYAEIRCGVPLTEEELRRERIWDEREKITIWDASSTEGINLSFRTTPLIRLDSILHKKKARYES